MDRELARIVIEECLARGADYADVRLQKTLRQELNVRDGKVGPVSDSEDLGLGIRVLVDGAWGFGSSPVLSRDRAMDAVTEALALARAARRHGGAGVRLSPEEPGVGSYETPLVQDPFSMDLEEKLEPLLLADQLLRGEGVDEVRTSRASAVFRREERLLLTSEGADVFQTLTESGGSLSAVAVGGGDMQVRSYPNGRSGLHRTGGFELLEELDLPSHAGRVARESRELVYAHPCPAADQPLVIDGSMMALQIHESVGHPVELDRVMGREVSMAGDSFLTPDLLGNLQFASEAATLRADATCPGGLGTYGWDDEGVLAQDVSLVDRGIFTGYLSSRDSASLLDQKSSGASRAVNYNHIPLVRMTNVNLDPGDWSIDEMMKEASNGLYVEGTKSGSIDQKRLNFQFGPEMGREIVDGSPGKMVKNPVYTGTTVEFWNGCLGIGNRDEWQIWGIPSCGKGQPGQTARVSHGSAPVLFDRVRVGVGS